MNTRRIKKALKRLSKLPKTHKISLQNPLMEHLERLIIIAIIFLFTFPAYYAGYGAGLDPSYVWGLNWLFINDYHTLTQLTYPFGPLAFLKIPAVIGHNAFISIVFYCLFKMGFIWLMFKLSDMMKNTDKLATVFVIFIVSFFTSIDFLIIGCCLLLMLMDYKKKSIIAFIISVLIAFIGLFIKLSIGISSLSIIGISVLVHLFYSKNIIYLIKQLGIIVLIGFITGLLVFRDIGTYFHFLEGAYKLSEGYGDVLSLHPNNNWLFLSLFLILMVVFPFISKGKDVKIAYLFSFFPLLAAWKHSFIREDIYHYAILLTFLFVFWGIIYVVSSKKTVTLLTASLTILLLYANMRNVNIPEYRELKKDIIGINNFREVLDYRTFKQKMLSMSENDISKNRLSPEIQGIIGTASVDIYPWDFSYIAANNFTWKPRKTLELGASTSRWASEKASENYLLKEESPQFVLFHLENDYSGGKLGSIDNRHILNDEPLVIHNLLNNYTLLVKTDKFLLFKRNTSSQFNDIYLDDIQDCTFGEWIDIPNNADEIIRLNVFSGNTFLGKINKMFYKETAYFVDYQFEDGIILTYRYIPQTAIDGLWCNPFIRYSNTDVKESKVVKVRFRNANPLFVKKLLRTQIQHIKIKSDLQDSTEIDNLLFHKSITPSKEIIVEMLQQSDNELSKTAGFSNIVEKNGYSFTYEIDLDSLFQTTEADYLTVEANVRTVNYYCNAGLVICAENTKEDFWAASYPLYSISKNMWHYSYLSKSIKREQHTSGVLKIYVFNYGKTPVYIDDFRVRITKQ